MSDEFDPYALSSGFKFDNVDAVITHAEFGLDVAKYDEATLFKVTFTYIGDEGKPVEELKLYSVGKGFEAIEKGAAVAHVSGRQQQISGNSNFGKFLASVFAIPEAMKYLRDGKLLPTRADTWIGTGWHVVNKVITNRTHPVTGLPLKDGYSTEVTKFLGKGFKLDGANSAAEEAPAGKVKGKGAKEDIDPELLAELIALAATFESDQAEKFVEAAFEREDVMASATVQNAVMETKRGSIWAKGQA